MVSGWSWELLGGAWGSLGGSIKKTMVFNRCFEVFGGSRGSKLDPKSTKNLSKRVSKIRYKFECILDGSWTDFGSILKAKLVPSWLQNRSKRGSKPM